MDLETIEGYVEYGKKILDENPQMDEANTKATLVRKLLDLLGWTIGTDANLEYPVQMATRTHKVDYALLLEDTPMVFVEAKGCDSSLSEDDREQLRSYMKSQNVDWGLLTDGRTNEFYQRNIENAQVTVNRLGRAEIDELVQKSNLLSALSKQSIKSGKSEQIAQRIIEIERVKDELQENKDEIAEEVARTIAERVGDPISKQAENEAKTLVDNLIAELEDEADVKHGETIPSDDLWTEVEREIGIIKENDGIILQENDTATQQFRDFVDFLLTQGYISNSDLPIESGPKRYILHSEPYDKEGDEMLEPKPVGNGFYLETHESTDSIKRKILKLGEQYS